MLIRPLLPVRRALAGILLCMLATSGVASAAAPGWHRPASSFIKPRPVALRALPGDGTTSVVLPSAAELRRLRSPRPAGVQFIPTFVDVPAAAKPAIRAALNYWGMVLDSPVPLEVQFNWVDLPGARLGQAQPTRYVANETGLLPNTYYPIGLANRLAGRDLAPGLVDINVALDPTYPWSFDQGPAVPADRYSLFSVVLHEVGHGLGFVSDLHLDASHGTASWSGGIPTIYDRFFANQAGQYLVSFANGSTQLADQANSGALYFKGARAANARIQAPPGSGFFSHLDYDTYKGTRDSLMISGLGKGQGRGTAGPIGLGVLADLGWIARDRCRAPHDLTADAANDLIARTSAGALWVYPRNAAGGFLPRYKLGTGFQAYDRLIVTQDFTGDGCTDLLGRTSDGRLWLLPGTDYGSLGTAVAIGTGWDGFNQIVAPGDWDGDGKADVIARTPDGRLFLYPGSGTGNWLPPYPEIGHGWDGFNLIVAPGDIDRDGHPDLLARTPKGVLWVYPGFGNGLFKEPKIIGYGWNVYNAIVGPGDWSGDLYGDLLARKPDGSLWLWVLAGTNRFADKTPQVGTGWDAFNLIR